MPSPEVKGVIVYVLDHTPLDGTRILFMKRAGGDFEGQFWPVAGTPKAGETPIETAERELAEETGLTGLTLAPMGKDIHHADGSSILAAFVTEMPHDRKITLNHEHTSYTWMTFGEALANAPPVAHQYFEHLRANFFRGG